MFFGGRGGGLPLPQTGEEWLGLILALVVIAVIAKRFLDED
ncbi:MAG: hypothetical protein ACRDH2_00565 [Anaerolineales bacterium]